MIVSLLLLIVGGVGGAALLTPAVYTGLVSLLGAEGMWPFSRVFDRVAMLCTLIMLLLLRDRFFLQAAKVFLTRGTFAQMLRDVALGIGLSLVPSLLVLPLVVGDGALVWITTTPLELLWKMIKVFPAALIISVIEEVFFRVLLLQSFRKQLSFISAAVLSSSLYTVVHFISPVKQFIYIGFQPWAGFTYLGVVGERYLSSGILEASVGLFLVGMLLCYTISRTSSLFLCIGLHAGWVMAMKWSVYNTTPTPGYVFASGIGQRYFLVAEPLSWASFIIVWAGVLVVSRYLINRHGSEHDPIPSPRIL